MKKSLLILIVALCSCCIMAQNMELGKITIRPYVPEGIMSARCVNLLNSKLTQILTGNDVVGGFERRFIIVPHFNIISEETTATVPQKTSLRIEIVIAIGDGVSGALFNSMRIEHTGIGDDTNGALFSAIHKIRTNDKTYQLFIEEAKHKIEMYYNKNIDGIIADARAEMAKLNYEEASAILAVVPSFCNRYDEVQDMIVRCGEQILKRDNAKAIMQARAAWSANPNSIGAQEAKGHLSQVVITSEAEKKEVNDLIERMQTRLIELKNMEIEFELAKMESSERIKVEEINASKEKATAFYQTLPSLTHSIIGWFL